MILPYDDVKRCWRSEGFSVKDTSIERQDLLGSGSARPRCTCLSFSPLPGRAARHLPEEALSILRQAEEAALVHTVSNVAAGVSYVCNCCGCCCGILRGITAHGLEHSVAAANYRASVDEQACTGCAVCEERCQVGAIRLHGSIAASIMACIGCGLCVGLPRRGRSGSCR
jgi:hypothetical protein